MRKLAKSSLGLLMVLFWTCASPPVEVQPDPRAIRAWHVHESNLASAVAGISVNDDFDEACLFFEQLTGISVHANLSTIGALPTEETRQDLEKIRRWYKENKHRLYWDASTNSVRLRS
jgi:hypothetical protein